MKNTEIHSVARLALASALITLTACGGSHGGSTGGTVTNGPTVAFTGSAQIALEAGGTVFVGVELSAVSTEPVTVPFGVGGSATEHTDFTIDPSPLVVPAGQTTAEIAIVVLDDALHEALEEIVLTLGAPTNAGLGALTTHTASLVDDDLPPVVEFEVPDAAVGEGGAAVIATLRLSAPSGLDVLVPFTVGGTADSDDVVSITDGPIVIPAGAISAAITITPADDLIDELDETVVLALGSPTNAELGTVITHTTLIADDDAPPTVAFEFAGQEVDEAAVEASIVVALSAPSGLEILVPYVVGGSATATADFELDPGSLVIPAGEVSASLALVVVDDVLDELDETVTITLEAPTHATLGAVFVHTASILDDDAAPSVAFTTPDQGLEEASGDAVATVELSAVSGLDVTVPFMVGGTATEGSDFTLAASPLVIPAGQVTAEIAITLVNDALQEPSETIEIALEAPTNASLGTSGVHTATIHDDDASPVVEFATPGSAVAEGSGAVVATLRLSVPSGFDVSVPFELLGTADVSDDYTTTASPVVIPAGATVANIVVVLADDALDEPDETAVIRISAPVHALAGPSDTYTLTLLDDDDPPTVAFATANQAAGEGAGLVAVDVVLSSASGFEVEIPFTVGGTATHLDDFLVSPDPPLIVVPAGQVTGVVTVTVVDDALDEPGETVVLSLGTPSNASLGGPAFHTVTILDDDAAPTLAFVAGSATVGEDEGTASFTVQLSAVSGQDVVVPYSVAGTADQPGDYSIAASPLLVPAGQAFADIELSLADDGVGEGDETVVVTLGTPTNADLGTPAQSELVILDDDPPVVEFVAVTQSTPEGAVAIAVVRLSNVAPLDVTVPFTVGGTADDPDDYTVSNSPLVIPAGQQTGMLDFVLVGDTLYEGDETIVVTLATPVNGTLGGQSSHTLTILDDDAPPTVQFATAAQTTMEPNPYLVVVTVELSQPSGTDLLVPYTLGGTATNPDDYSIQQSPIAIPAGAISANIALAMVDDALGEIDETIELTLVAPPGSTVGAIGVHTITIFDNDGGPGPSSDLVLEPAAWTMFVGETVTLTALGQQVDDVVWHVVEPMAGDFRDTGSATTRSNPAQFVGGRYPGDWRVTVSNMTTGAEASVRVTLLPLELTFHDMGVTEFTKAPQRGPAWARSVLPTSPAFEALPLVAIDPRGLATGPIVHVVIGGSDGAILSFDRGGVPVGASPIAPEVDLSAIRAVAVDPEGGVMLAGERALVRVRGGETEVWIPEIPMVGIRDLSVGPRGAIWIAAFDDADPAAGSIRVLNAIGREIAVIREFQVDGSIRVLRRPFSLAVGPDGSIHIFEELARDGVGVRAGVRRIVAEPTIAPRYR